MVQPPVGSVTPGGYGTTAEDTTFATQDNELHLSRSASPGSEANDDVVHCICGDNTDEGFMIQCEQCLCWQHGDCIGIRKERLPRQYLCCFCTDPPGLRQNKKYQYDLQWYCDGTLPSLPGGPDFPCPQTILNCHTLLDRLHLLRKMSHSSKVKLQAASNPSHAYLRQWSKECAGLDKETLKNYLSTALHPIVIQSSGTHKPTTNTSISSSGSTSGSNRLGQSSQSDSHQPDKSSTVEREGAKEISSNNNEVASSSTVKGVRLTNGSGVSEDSKRSSVPVRVATNKIGGAGCVKMSVLTQTSVHSSSLPVGSKVEGQLLISTPKETRKVTEVKPQQPTVSTEVEFAPEFGLQETAVFATNPCPNIVASKQQQQLPLSSNTLTKQPTMANNNSSTSVSQIVSPLLPSSNQKRSLQTIGNHSSFKTVVATATPRSSGSNVIPSSSPPLPGGIIQLPGKLPTTSQLTSLLTSPLSTQPVTQLPLVSSPSLPLTSSGTAATTTPTSLSTPGQNDRLCAGLSSQDVSQQQTSCGIKKEGESVITQSDTQLSRLKLLPDITGDPVFAKTAVTLPPPRDSPSSPVAPVLLQDFTEAFVQGDTTSWFKRMLLLDHLESVQDGIQLWIEQMEREMDDMEGGSGEEESCALNRIHETLEQLSRFKFQQQNLIGNSQ